MLPFPPGSALVFYFRDSGHEDQELSIPQQETEGRKWAIENGYTIYRIYRDSITAKSTTGRDQFHEMMHAFRQGFPEAPLPVAGLVIWKFSRFARNIDDAQFYKADLRRRGYEIYSLQDKLPPGPEGRFFESAIDWMNQRYLEDLSIDVQRGLRQLVLEYGCVPGTPPRGFKRTPVLISHHRDGKPHTAHRWDPDPALTPTIQHAYQLLLSGATARQILTQTRLFKSNASLPYFFSNPIYKGTLHYADLIIENYCDPIIDPATWDIAQTILAKRESKKHLPGGGQDHPRRRGSDPTWLLTGLLHCARCGAKLNINADGQWQAYICPNRKKFGTCDLKAIPKTLVETAVLNTLNTYVLAPDILHAIQTTTSQHRQNAQTYLTTQLTAKNTEHQATSHKITNTTNAIAAHGHSAALLKSLTVLETQLDAIQTEIATLETQLAAQIPDLTDDQIQTTTDRIKARLQKDPETVRNTLHGLTHKIIVDRDYKKIIGQILFYHPSLTEKPPPTQNRAMMQTPAGAPPHSPVFSTPFEHLITHKKKPRP